MHARNDRYRTVLVPAYAQGADGKLPEAARRGDVGLGFPRYASRMKTVGTVKAVVLFADFPDALTRRTPESAFSLIAPRGPRFYKTVSYGKMDLQLAPHFRWLRMRKPSKDYSFRAFATHRAYLQEAIALADPDVDFAGAQAVYVIANPDARALPNGPAFCASSDRDALRADGNRIHNAATSGFDLTHWGPLWLNHEVGHTMGLPDLYAFAGDAPHRFVGGFSLMGLISGFAPEYLAYERWLLGWLDDAQVVVQKIADATTRLTAIETVGGVKTVLVRTGPTSAVVVECRRALGYDSALPKEGALVYTVDTALPSGNGPIRVLPNNDPQRAKSPLAMGETLAVGKVTITVVNAASKSDMVRVTVAR